jgi:threonine aldolase
MREAMALAELGDDVYGEDPTVNRLERLTAQVMGKEAALFVPSGTMANLAALLAHCNRGDEVILGDLSHTFLYEAGGAAALGGVHPYPLPNQPDGTLELERIEAAVRPDNVHFPITRLVCLENTHNRCGGVALSAEYTEQVAALCRAHGLALHLDGARIFNAAVALGVQARRLAGPADSVSFCLSKGLCAPVGSLLCGSEAFIRRARRVRKQLGGGMRQAGVLAAAGIIAIEEMSGRLAQDHTRARALADRLKELPWLVVENDPPATNMVFLRLERGSPLDAAALAERCSEKGVRIGVVSEDRLRLVTHYWIDDRAVDRAAEVMAGILQGVDVRGS